MDLPIIASMWVGGRLTVIEQLCLKSFVDHGHRVILYSYQKVDGVPDGVELFDARRILPQDDILIHRDSGSPALHAYRFRYRLLEMQNVIWVDLDMLCVKPWDFNSQWVYGWEVEGVQIGAGALGLPRFSKGLAKMNGFCSKAHVSADWAKIEPGPIQEQPLPLWSGMGLTHFLNDTGEASHVRPQSAFYPVPFKQRGIVAQAGNKVEPLIGDDTFGVHLWNRRLSMWIRRKMGGEIAPDSFLGLAMQKHGRPVTTKYAAKVVVVEKPVEQPKVEAAVKEKRKPKMPTPKKVRLDMPPNDACPMARRPIDPNLPTVAGLWIGGTLSFLEQVCLLSFRDYGHRTVLYTYKGVDKVPDGIEVLDANAVMPSENYIKHKNSDSPALHSDVFRYYMIKQTGYVWIDADVLCVRPWAIDNSNIYGWEKPPNLICGAVLGLDQNSKTLESLIDFCKDEYPIPPWAGADEKARLQQAHDQGDPVHVTDLKWGVWGPSALTYFLKETGEVEHTLSREAFYPVTFKDRRELLEPNFDLTGKVGRGCYGVHLWNRRIRRRIVTDEVGLPHPESLLGKALLRHNVDPTLSLIPDTPPPGSPKQEEVLAQKPAHEVDKLRAEYDRRAEIYGAISEKTNVIGTPTPSPLVEFTGGKQADVTDEDAVDVDDQQETPEASRNPNVIVRPPAALKTMPVMPLVQSPEYQAHIDNLEGRTGDITGYLRDPAEKISNDNILIVTSMKNEAPFILEWVAYHLSIGVTHFLVYTNDCSDNTNDILDRLQDLGHVTRVPNPWVKDSGKKPQHVALKDALSQPAFEAADWVLTIDCDEFVNIHVGDGTFADFFKAANYPNVASFTWKFFGNKGVERYDDRPIIEQFTACAPEFIPKPRLGWGFKSMFHKSSPYTRIGVHRPLGIEDHEADQVRWVNGSGRAMPDMLLTNNGWRSTKRSVGYRLATLNHYILRSTESFLVKRERGRINHTEHDQGIDYWTRRNYATETDDRITARLPGFYKVFDRLKQDETLAKLHNEAVEWHRGRIKHLLGNADYKSLYDDLTKPGRPDALTLAEEAEKEAAAADSQSRATVALKAPSVALKPANPLTSLRLMSPPSTAAKEPVHARFNDARAMAEKIKGFVWEGPENALMFAPRSKRLVVAFDNISIAREEGQRWPWGFKVLWQEMGCSVLGVMCVKRNWFRQEFVHDAMESLRDQGFFDQFDEIMFYGASMGGYGALAYQALAPGSNVLTIAPQSTLSREILSNEDRWGWTKGLDWSGRYADVVGTTDLAKNVFIIADPYYKPDFDQVSRITGDNVSWLHTPFMGHQLPNAFVVMGILKDLLYAGAGGTLTPQMFYKWFRARNDLPRYQHDLLMEAEKRGKIKSAIRICEYTLKKRKAQNIKRTLGKLQEKLAEMERQEAAE